jgi:hypothetical protein
MKTITVAVQIQMDIKENQDSLTQVKDTLELMNTIISASKIEAQPQIFISEITNQYII